MAVILRKLETHRFRAYINGLIALAAVVAICCLLPLADHRLVRFWSLFLSYPGNQAFIVMALLLLSLPPLTKRRWREAAAPVVVLIAVSVLVHIAKVTIGPWTPRPTGSPGGFPSGHSATAFAFALFLSVRYPRWSPAWYAAAVVIACSRIGMQCHYLYQVVGGVVVGLTFMTMVINRCLAPAEPRKDEFPDVVPALLRECETPKPEPVLETVALTSPDP